MRSDGSVRCADDVASNQEALRHNFVHSGGRIHYSEVFRQDMVRGRAGERQEEIRTAQAPLVLEGEEPTSGGQQGDE